MTASLHDWLADSDPAVRWQVMRDLFNERDDAVERERARTATEGWGAGVLSRQRPDGRWGVEDGTPLWLATLNSMGLLWDFGVNPASPAVRAAIARVHDRVTWGPEFGDSPFFEGEVEPCINGRTLGLGAYFGHPSPRLLDRLLAEQLADGGWNCEAERGSVRSSFHSTICVLEGLLQYVRTCGSTPAIAEAQHRGHEYLLARGLFRRLSTGEPIRDRKADADWTRFAFPTTWHYDILRGLDYFRTAGVRRDDRMTEALDLVTARRDPDGRWQAYQHPKDAFEITIETPGGPSRSNTLRAIRVLRWFGRE